MSLQPALRTPACSLAAREVAVVGSSTAQVWYWPAAQCAFLQMCARQLATRYTGGGWRCATVVHTFKRTHTNLKTDQLKVSSLCSCRTTSPQLSGSQRSLGACQVLNAGLLQCASSAPVAPSWMRTQSSREQQTTRNLPSASHWGVGPLAPEQLLASLAARGGDDADLLVVPQVQSY